MYCPVCFQNGLKLKSKGIVKVSFDGKAKATSQFYYDLSNETKEDLLKKMSDVLVDYFKYYSQFQNISPIKHIELLSSDFACENKCAIKLDNRQNVIGLIISKKELESLIVKKAQEYSLPLNLEW